MPIDRFGDGVKVNSGRAATGWQQAPRVSYELRTGRSARQPWRAVNGRSWPGLPVRLRLRQTLGGRLVAADEEMDGRWRLVTRLLDEAAARRIW